MARPGGWCALRSCTHGLIWHVFVHHSQGEYAHEASLRGHELDGVTIWPLETILTECHDADSDGDWSSTLDQLTQEDPEQLRALVARVQREGMPVPIVIHDRDTVVAGRNLVLVAMLLELAWVPVKLTDLENDDRG